MYWQVSKIGIPNIEVLWVVDLAEGNSVFLRNSFVQLQVYTVSQHRKLPSEVVRTWKNKGICYLISNSWKLRPRHHLHNLRSQHYTKPIRKVAHLSYVHYIAIYLLGFKIYRFSFLFLRSACRWLHISRNM